MIHLQEHQKLINRPQQQMRLVNCRQSGRGKLLIIETNKIWHFDQKHLQAQQISKCQQLIQNFLAFLPFLAP